MKAWIFLIIAGALEIVWASGLKRTDGFTKLWPTVFTAVSMILSFYFLSRAIRDLPMGTAYAVWTGIGAAGTALVGILWAGEPAGLARLACLLLILLGTVGLKLTH
jgi:quaternary ammonium compound-resistance protein SugE